MVITKPGKYRLLEHWNSRGTLSIAQLQKGTVLDIKQVDTKGRKIIGTPLLDWTLWDLPVERVEEYTFEEAESFFADFYLGKHHIPGKIKAWGPGWQINQYGSLSTFDFDGLTRLVFLAHDRCIRVEIGPSGPGRIRIMIHKRNHRDGLMFEKHPTIETALKLWRKHGGND